MSNIEKISDDELYEAMDLGNAESDLLVAKWRHWLKTFASEQIDIDPEYARILDENLMKMLR